MPSITHEQAEGLGDFGLLLRLVALACDGGRRACFSLPFVPNVEAHGPCTFAHRVEHVTAIGLRRLVVCPALELVDLDDFPAAGFVCGDRFVDGFGL